MTSPLITIQGISLPDLLREIQNILPISEQPETVKLYSEKEVCDMLGIARQTLYELVNKGKIARVKIGKSNRYSHAEIVKFIDRNKVRVA